MQPDDLRVQFFDSLDFCFYILNRYILRALGHIGFDFDVAHCPICTHQEVATQLFPGCNGKIMMANLLYIARFQRSPA